MASFKGKGRDRGAAARRRLAGSRHRGNPAFEILEGRTLLSGTTDKPTVGSGLDYAIVPLGANSPTVNRGDFYYQGGQKQPLLESTDELVVGLTAGASSNVISQLTAAGGPLAGFTAHATSKASIWLLTHDPFPGTPDSQSQQLGSAAKAAQAVAGVAWATPAFVHGQTGGLMVVTDQLVVSLKPGVDPRSFFQDIKAPNYLGYQPLVGTSDQFIATAAAGAGRATLNLANALASDPRVNWASPDFMTMHRQQQVNDPLFPSQWYLNNTGQSGGIAGADAHVVGAWDQGYTGAGVTIAVLDDGFQLDHPDLAANIYVNPREVPGNNADDDGNGYPDDTHGWDFADNDNDPSPGSAADNHGTNVAGIAAGVGNNSQGIAGAAFNAKILTVRVPLGVVAPASTFAEAEYYASGRNKNGVGTWGGADVLNHSYGSDTPTPVEQAAFDWSAANGRGGKGAINFASSGNNADQPSWSVGMIEYPAAYASVIAVGATTDRDVRSTFSQYGSDLELTAPGTGLPTTDRTGAAGYVAGDYNPSFTGTSAASPLAAGVGALVVQANPALTFPQVRQVLEATADKIGGVSYVNGFNQEYGFGRVDAAAAVAAVGQLQVISSAPAPAATTGSAPTFLSLTFSRPVDPTTVQASDLQFFGPAGVSIAVGQPGVSGNTVVFPLSITAPPGVSANGLYTYRLLAGTISSADGRALTAYNSSLTVADTIPPKVAGVTNFGRYFVIQLSEAVRPEAINATNVQVVRSGPTGLFLMAGDLNLSALPGGRVAYDPSTYRVVVDLSAVDQSLLPTDHYGIVVTDAIQDLAGNALDGEFNGTFWTGNNVPGGWFVDNLGVLTLAAPQVTSLALAPASDTGIAGDQNTRALRPTFVGQVSASTPGTFGGLLVVAQFNGLNNGNFDLTTGPVDAATGLPRGFAGAGGPSYVTALTDQWGNFTITAPANLPDGFNRVRVVVVGASDKPPLPGYSSQLERGFRVDTTAPTISAATINGATVISGARLNGLSSLSLNVVDPIVPASGPLAVPVNLSTPALDPATATNVSNYSLINLGPDLTLGTADDRDFSSFITGAAYVGTSNRKLPGDPYTGRVDLTFAPGLPQGRYLFLASTTISQANVQGLLDAAGNPLDGDPVTPGNQNYGLVLDIQPQPAYIIADYAVSALDGSLSGPRSYFEVPAPGAVPRAPAPPTQFVLDFSTALDPTRNYADAVQVIGSADAAGGTPDGDFGDLGTAGGNRSGFSRVMGTSVVLTNSVVGATYGQPGYLNRLIVTLPGALTPDHYRLYVPNAIVPAAATGINSTGKSEDLRLFDIFGNQVDGEFLGDQVGDNPLAYETLLPTGQYRTGLSGDGTPGGAFMTGYLVVPNGNVIFARPDYVDDPFLATDDPDGSQFKPYPALAPEAVTTAANNGDLNSAVNFGTGFNPILDRNGNGHFDRSALFAAQQRQLQTRAPVVVVALPGQVQNTGTPGVTQQKPYVLQAPTGADAVRNDASVSLPYNTTLVFQPGVTVKLLNAAILAQNQGTAIQVVGGSSPANQVTFTSYLDDLADGDTNKDGSNTQPGGGDWGGISFRSFDQRNRNTTFPIDGTLKGPNGAPARSGVDDALSVINNATIRYAGGQVPQTVGTRYDAVTLNNARPAITNSFISHTGGGGSSRAAISGDFDSFREDDLTRGPLIRRTTVADNSLNGIWIQALPNGVAQQSEAITYPDNPSTSGGSRNFVFDDPLPYILTSQLLLGRTIQPASKLTSGVTNRLYIQPGMILKSNPGAGIVDNTTGSSLIIGDRTYIHGFDLDPTYGPTSPGFQANTTGDAQVILTSLYDDNATSSYTDPMTLQRFTIVPAIDSDNGGPAFLPTPGSVPAAARWGGVTLNGGVIAVIDETSFRYGGGPLNTQQGTTQEEPALTLTGTSATISVTNNDFLDNAGPAMRIEPNGLVDADPQHPLTSGNPFFRGNVMLRNTYNGLLVNAGVFGPGSNNNVDLTVDSIWDDTDLTYILRGTVILGGGFFGGGRPLPDPTKFTEEIKPNVSLTIMSNLPDTLLANGTRIPRPGESAVVKLLSAAPPAGDANAGSAEDSAGGAGFLVGVDDGRDPTDDPLIDAGAGSQIRIVGIGASDATTPGATRQERVPVILTSLMDNSIPRTIRGVDQSDTYPVPDPARDPLAAGRSPGQPMPGDGGLIYFGANSLFDYNLWDPRDGNVIDNADIRYMTRIEVQGGGVMDAYDATGDGTFDDKDNPRVQKLGNTPLTQNNMANAMAISNSNLAFFSQVGVLAHPGFNMIVGRDVGPLAGFTPINTAIPFRSGFAGQPVDLFLYNNTISNMPVGVRDISNTGIGPLVQGDTMQEPYWLVLLHNTFDTNGTSLNTISPPGQGGASWNSFSAVRWLAMNNIFSNNTTEAITSVGQTQGSQGQYNLFYNNASDFSVTNQGTILNPAGGFGGMNGSVFGNPMYRNPAALDFRLMAGSAAIDASRSELGPNGWGNMLAPIDNQTLNAAGGIRNNTGRLGGLVSDGFFGGGGVGSIGSTDVVNLPGSGLRTFFDEWVRVLPGTPGAVGGPGTDPSALTYTPTSGVRDQNGYRRYDDPTTPRVGSGHDPFFDIGAFEHVVFTAPHVTGVFAVLTSPAAPLGAPVDIYKVGGIAGANQAPRTLQVTFDHQIDPATINGMSVVLLASGGDGLFGNGNSPADRAINLAGKLSFNPATNTLTINLSAAGVTLGSDVYRLVLRGTGANPLVDPQGNVLDGENIDANGLQQPLPSGDGFPGGDFQATFTIDTNPPAVVAGTFGLDPASDTNVVGDGITRSANPTFVGRITDVFPPVSPLLGQTVILDIDTNGDGIYDRMNAGVATTDAQGNFRVTVAGAPLPDSPFLAGANGLRGPGVPGPSIARIRVVDQAGNVSSVSDMNAVAWFYVDTQAPVILGSNPAPQTQATVSNGTFQVALVTSETLAPASLNANSIRVSRAGPDGVLGTADDVSTGLAATITSIVPTGTPTGGEMITVTVTGATVNDLYRVLLSGTGASAITDLAGNPLNATAPGGAGVDLPIDVVVVSPGNARTIFVGTPLIPGAPIGSGTRSDPFVTIGQAMAAAGIGDMVAVLPGVYPEQVTLKSLVRLVSADPGSTDGFVLPGDPLQTIIRSPYNGAAVNATVTGSSLISTPGAPTELRGFTVAGDLAFNPASGPIASGTYGLLLDNSDVIVDHNYFVDASYGIVAGFSGANARAPKIYDNGIIGNINGLLLMDNGLTSLAAGPIAVNNNTFAYNTVGLIVAGGAGVPTLVSAANNLFAANHDTTAARAGTAISAAIPGKVILRNNLFSGNGPNEASPADDTANIGGGFDPALLTATGDVAGNFTGLPAFVRPRDPRPTGDGPAAFFFASFDLAANSAAIDRALDSLAPTDDLLNRLRVDIPNRGTPGVKADVGAFEFNGTPSSSNLVFTPPSAPPAATTTAAVTGTVVRSAAVAPAAGTPNAAVQVASATAPTTVAQPAAVAADLSWVDAPAGPSGGAAVTTPVAPSAGTGAGTGSGAAAPVATPAAPAAPAGVSSPGAVVLTPMAVPAVAPVLTPAPVPVEPVAPAPKAGPHGGRAAHRPLPRPSAWRALLARARAARRPR